LLRLEDVKKSIFKFAAKLGAKKIALGCPISDRWGVGKHLVSKIKSRELKQINFFTSSCPFNFLEALSWKPFSRERSMRPAACRVCHADSA
jgi:hypothetical protein